MEVSGKVLDTDEEGYISNLSEWERVLPKRWPRMTTAV